MCWNWAQHISVWNKLFSGYKENHCGRIIKHIQHMQWVYIEYYSFCVQYLWFFFSEEVFHAINIVWSSAQVQTLPWLFFFLKKGLATRVQSYKNPVWTGKGVLLKPHWLYCVLTTTAFSVNQDTFVALLNCQTKPPGRAWLPLPASYPLE